MVLLAAARRRAGAAGREAHPVGGGGNGDWRIAVLAHTYPFLRYTGARIDSLNAHQDWTGLLKISRGPDEEFILFGYLNANGEVGVDFMASTPDRTLLATFYDDIDRLTTSKPPNRVPVDVFNGPDLELTESDSLPPPPGSRHARRDPGAGALLLRLA